MGKEGEERPPDPFVKDLFGVLMNERGPAPAPALTKLFLLIKAEGRTTG